MTTASLSSESNKLYRRLPLLILAIGLMAVLSGVLALRYLQTRMIGTAGEGLALAASDIADKLSHELFERYTGLQIFARTAETYMHDRSALTAYLETVRRVYPVYLWLAVADATGTIIASTDPASVGKDRSRQPWFQFASGEAQVYVGEVSSSPDAGKSRVVSIAAPITDRPGRFAGAVVAHVGIAALEDTAVRSLRSFQAMKGYYGRLEYELLTSSGEVFVDSLKRGEESLNLKHLGLPSAELLSAGKPGYVSEMHLRRHVPVLTGYAQTEGYGRFPGLKWGILIRLDERDVLSPIRKVQRVLALVAALVFVPVLGFLLWTSARLRREGAQAQEQHARAQEAEQRIRDIVEHSTNLFYSHTPDHVLTYLSPQARTYLGYDPAEARIRWTEFLTDNPCNQKGVELTQRAIDTGQAQPPYELELKTKDGRVICVEVHEAPVVRDGKTVAVVGSLTDITERKKAEAALQEANARLSALISSSPLAIAVLNPDGRVGLWNPAAEAMFGWTRDEIIGRSLPIVPPGRMEEHLALRSRTLKGEAITGIELVRQKKSGASITISLSTAPLRDSNGTITGILGIMTDVTQAKQLEHHARRLEHMALLGQLMGGIAHEIKNPLFVLTGSMQLLNDRLANKEYADLRGDLDRMDEAAKRMMQSIQRFLTLARPAPPAQEVCAVQAILQQTLDFLRHEFLTNQVSVEANLTPDLPSIESDPRLLQEVFLNLVVNAVQAMREAHGKGKLTASPRPRVPASDHAGHGDTEKGRRSDIDHWIEVRIQDDGPGVAPEHRDKLFEPFFTTKPPGIGTGLGLWTVRSNLTTLGGAVTFETEVGQGTTFIVRLPLVREQTRGWGGHGGAVSENRRRDTAKG
ncbi:MAG: PAS domain S-box protein [Nitrospirota bacterium]